MHELWAYFVRATGLARPRPGRPEAGAPVTAETVPAAQQVRELVISDGSSMTNDVWSEESSVPQKRTMRKAKPGATSLLD